MIGSPQQTFGEAGYCGPIDLLSSVECTLLSRYFDDRNRPRPRGWSKGLAASDRVVYEVATRPRLVSLLRQLLGSDFVLWGASVVDRDPGQEHAWHTDIETSAAGAGTVNVWIGLENTSAQSALKLIEGSHRIGKPLQQVATECGISRADRTASVTLEVARRLHSDARLVEPEMRDGQALLFDGRAWHGSLNTRATGRRRALLLQYAAADVRLRIPDWHHLEWPFVFKESPRPPVVALGRTGNRGVNRIVSPPSRSDVSILPLQSLTRAIPSPLSRDPQRGWKPHPLYRGSTSILRHLNCHVSVLEPGHSPHPPHSHLDEELLVVVDGEADVVVANAVDDSAPRVERLLAGDMIYYPSYQFHTIRCSAATPVTYFMYRWQAALRESASAMPTAIFRAAGDAATTDGKGFSTSLVFQGATAFLDKLHVHRSRARDGGGYRSHTDEHDVAILLLTGQFETQGRRVHAPSVVFYPAGAAHGLRGKGPVGAEYLVVEFHGPRSADESRAMRLQRAARNHLRRLKRTIERALGTLTRRRKRR